MNTVETRETVLDRIRTRVAAGLRSDEGFVLLDVLIGIAVLALLLLTAIQSIGPMRQRSYQSTTQSDARQVATTVEGYITDNPTLAMPASAAALNTALSTAPNVAPNMSSSNSIVWFVPGASQSYVFCVEHDADGSGAGTAGDAAAWYQSAKGAITKTLRGATGDCGAVPADFAAATTAATP